MTRRVDPGRRSPRDVTPEAWRAAFASQICPLCDRGPFRALPLHVVSVHEIGELELRNLALVDRAYPMTSPETRERHREIVDLGKLRRRAPHTGPIEHTIAGKRSLVAKARAVPRDVLSARLAAAVARMTPEERSAKARAAWARMTPEERSARRQRFAAAVARMTPEELSARARQGRATRSARRAS